MQTAEIRESFLDFFEGKGCTRLPSASLVPDDPALLLTVAGMVPFKPVFLGIKKLDTTRATTAQKCVRTNDIDIIGTTGRHLSFFEMLGNFSFGDYFKREAISWAYEYSTEILGLESDRLWASVFTDDDEAADLWVELTDIPAERVVRFGEEDNFWAAGPTGPCGPCSELYYDRGEEYSCGPDCKVGCECDRFVEYWNLVFMQYDRDEKGNLAPLSALSVDTGLGLERMAAIMQGVQSNYEIDLMQNIMTLIQEITHTTYGRDPRSDVSLRIITDHARAVAFLIADGVLPSNEGRGYILRRLLRRAVLHARLLGVSDPFMVQMTDQVIENMSDAYPELSEHRDLIAGVVAAEEERFSATLRTGLAYLDEALGSLAEGDTLDGETIFVLHDTYGFPFDLTVEIAGERAINVDEEGYLTRMEEQKSRARATAKDEGWDQSSVYTELAREFEPTDFVGYALDETDATVLALIRKGKRVDALEPGQSGEILLDRTSAYGEQGGQSGDKAHIRTAEGALFKVKNTSINEGHYLHRGRVKEGSLKVGDKVSVSIDAQRRERIARNHTATHLLHTALRKVLGSHVAQAGSLVAPQRLRFDFTHFEALTDEQIDEVEHLVNRKIFENIPVRAFETSLETAREQGVTALFGEKYGEFVRVIDIDAFSKELCGGTHVGRSAEIGLFKIINEESVGANLRRIEAVTSLDAYEHLLERDRQVQAAASTLHVAPREVADRVTTLATKLKETEARLKQALSAKPEDSGRSLDEITYEIEGYRLVVDKVDHLSAADLKPYWDATRTQGRDAVVLIGTDKDTKKAIYLAAANDAAVARGFDAGALVKEIAHVLGGRGGGKPTMAQGGADQIAHIDDALAKVGEILGVTLRS
ncbi:MAG: alanine--tRNA ligase [Coriobacteriia bacterium]|nr:alanine--tRNA ligase [Coriobacteriia bacterium]